MHIKENLKGGVVSAIVALPQALAFGVATGLGASAGIYGAIILCFIAALFGGKLPLISGPTGPVAIIVAASFADNPITACVSIFALAAIFQILISLTNAPKIVKYVPYPVISGFMNGVGMILILMQINPLIGIPACSSSFDSIKNFILNLSAINYEAFLLGILTLLILFSTPKKIKNYIPAEILALIFCTLLSIQFNFNIDRISDFTVSMPSITLPVLNLKFLSEIIPVALTLAVVSSSESLLTALVADSLTKEKTNQKQLIFSLGIGNFLCAITGSLIGSAATMRTVAAIKAGAVTKLAAFFNSIVLILVIFCFAPFVKSIPLAVLAGILIKVGFDIIDTKLLRVVKYAPKDDLYVLATVFLLTVFYNLVFAVGIGITLSALLYAKRIADKTKIKETVYSLDEIALEKEIEHEFHYGIRMVHIDGQFFFGSVTQIVSHFDEMLGTKYLILIYDSAALLDISAIFALEDIIERLKSQHIELMVVVHNDEVLKQLGELIPEKYLFNTEYDAIEYAKNHITTLVN